jgi:hypothetical protein
MYIRLERFCMGKFQTQKFKRAVLSLKVADTHKEHFLFLRLFKFLSVDGCASALEIEKMAKKLKKFQYFGDFFPNLKSKS